VRPAGEQAAFLAGFVVAEGCFTGTGRRRFRFAVHLGGADRQTCWSLLASLGVGHVYTYDRRQTVYDDESVFVVTSLPDLVEVIVPFMDEHLPPSYKRIST
jgi:hypothetical protein